MTRKRFIWRWLWNGAVVMSLVMMVGVGVVLAASYWRYLRVTKTQSSISLIANSDLRKHRKVRDGVVAQRGMLILNHSLDVTYVDFMHPPQTSAVEWDRSIEPLGQPIQWPRNPDFTLLGVCLNRNEIGDSDVVLGGGTIKFRWIYVSLIYPLTLSAILPMLWLILWYRNRPKRLPNHCRQCGYNLTGTISAGRTQCPECGATAKQVEMPKAS